MKKLSKTCALLAAAAMTLSLAACSGGTSGSSESPAPSGSAPAQETGTAGETYLVGICQLAPHDALDRASKTPSPRSWATR